MKSTQIQLGEKTCAVTHMPIGKYPELLRILKNIPGIIEKLSGISNDQLFSELPDLIAENLDHVVRIAELSCDLTKEEIEELDLKDFITLAQAIVEENRISEVADTLKGLFQKYLTSEPAAKEEQAEPAAS